MNVSQKAGYKLGDKFKVVKTDCHNFPLGSVVTLVDYGEDKYEWSEFSLPGTSNTQVLRLAQVEFIGDVQEPLESQALDIVLGNRLVRGNDKTLTEKLMALGIPYLLTHRFGDVTLGELFKTVPYTTITEVVDDCNLTPFEYLAILTLLDQYKLEN